MVLPDRLRSTLVEALAHYLGPAAKPGALEGKLARVVSALEHNVPPDEIADDLFDGEPPSGEKKQTFVATIQRIREKVTVTAPEQLYQTQDLTPYVQRKKILTAFAQSLMAAQRAKIDPMQGRELQIRQQHARQQLMNVSLGSLKGLVEEDPGMGKAHPLHEAVCKALGTHGQERESAVLDCIQVLNGVLEHLLRQVEGVAPLDEER
jgi:hypothetical protein